MLQNSIRMAFAEQSGFCYSAVFYCLQVFVLRDYSGQRREGALLGRRWCERSHHWFKKRKGKSVIV